VFDGGRVKVETRGGGDSGTFELPAADAPNRIDFWLTEHRGRGNIDGAESTYRYSEIQKAEGVYRLDAGRLTLCLVPDALGGVSPGRPADFVTRPGDSRWLFVFEREAP